MRPLTPEEQEAAFAHIVANKDAIEGAILAVVRNRAVANEVFSDTTVEIIRCYSAYNTEMPFLPWAAVIAQRVARANMRRAFRADRAHLCLDEEALIGVMDAIQLAGEQPNLLERCERLKLCMGQLQPKQHSLLWLFFFEDHTYEEVAEFAKVRPSAIYSLFSRLYKALGRCILRKSEAL